MTWLQTHGVLPAMVSIPLVLILPILAWWLYRREVRQIGSPYSWALPLLRSVAILFALLMLFQPSLHHRWHEGQPGRIDFLLDVSASMTLADNPLQAGVRRFDQAVDVLLAGQESLLQQLSEGNEVSVAGFSDQAVDVLWESNLRQRPELPVSGQVWEPTTWVNGTAIGQAVKQLVAPEIDLQPPSAILGGAGASPAKTPDAKLFQASGPPPEGVDLDLEPSQQLPIVLLSDGQTNSGPNPMEFLPQLLRSGRPVYAIGFGNPEGGQDVSLRSVQKSDQIFRSDLLSGTVLIDDRLDAGQVIRISIGLAGENVSESIAGLANENDDDVPLGVATPETLLDSRFGILWQTELVSQGEGQREVKFSFAVESLIQQLADANVNQADYTTFPLTFVASVNPVEGELTVVNNSQKFTVGVSTRRQRVLILDSRSRWETRYLRNSLERDPNWEVDAFLLQAGREAVRFSQGDIDREYPQTLEQWLHYDLIVLGELQPGSLDSLAVANLLQFVSGSGGGLIVVDGQRGYWRDSSFAALTQVLPVQFVDDANVGVDANSGPDERQLWSVVLSEFGQRLPAMQLSQQPEQNQQLWQQLPAMQFVATVTPSPGSQVLANLQRPGQGQADAKSPYLVSRLYGAGRILYVASDESWRWRYAVADTYHQRFWNQMGRWVMRVPFAVQSEFVSLDPGKIQYAQGDLVQMRVRLSDRDGQPADLDLVEVVLGNSEGSEGLVGVKRLTLRKDPSFPGVYVGQVIGLEPGGYEMTVQAEGYQQGMLDAQARFWVQGPVNTEWQNLNCNQAMLRQISEQTGGKYLHQSQASQLSDLLSAVSDGKFLESDTMLWRSYGWFIPIVLVLALEWWLRKQAGLI